MSDELGPWGKLLPAEVRGEVEFAINGLREALEVTVQQRDALADESRGLRDQVRGAHEKCRIFEAAVLKHSAREVKLSEALRACLDEMKAYEVWPGWADRAEDLLK